MEFLIIPAVLLCIVIGILWILMPFAIFGTKDLLRELVQQQQRTNELLDQIRQQGAPKQSAQEPIRINCATREQQP